MKTPGKVKQIKFQAVAFDLDGTLYPNLSFYRHLIPFLLKESKFLRAFGKARDRLREKPLDGMFFQNQAEYVSKILKEDPAALEVKIDNLIYRGWEPFFKKVRLFSHVKETLTTLRDNGIKLGLLSDFPPDVKLANLGINGFWDAVLDSEETGRLKPDALPFKELARAMGFPPDEILYVGNSFSYDVLGAKKAGFKAAWIRPKIAYFFPDYKKERKADFVFFDYRQLSKFVLT
ncbi:MAG: HAD family hydrolase [Treponema sp.]|nr:HAD family hydrolase [Treponema sp.]